jgi:imidazolonepropionase-like amidohydrolase
MSKTLGGMTFFLLLSLPAFFPGHAATSNGFVIRGARVFDGHKVVEHADVWVEGGKIKAIGNGLKVSTDVKVVEAAGGTLLPGLIDSHTHTWGDARKEAEIFGVTTELDMFTTVDFMQQTKKAQAEGKATTRADLFSAGSLATVPGGHGTEYGVPVPTLTSPSEAQAWVDARIAEGSDYIKIIVESGTYGRHDIPTLDQATTKAIIAAAHARGKLVVVHVSKQKDAHDVIEDGADGLAHLFTDTPPDPGFAAFVAAHHAFVIPTLAVLEGLDGIRGGESLANDARLAPYLTSTDISNLKQSFPKYTTTATVKNAELAIPQLKLARVPILAGTDSPNPGTCHGVSIHREMELLVQSGLTPQEALATATSAPAAAFHLADRGVIAPGKRADLLLVKGDPTRDITATRDIVSVWKLGVEDDRASYRAAIEKAKAAQAPLQRGWMAATRAVSGARSKPWPECDGHLAGSGGRPRLEQSVAPRDNPPGSAARLVSITWRTMTRSLPTCRISPDSASAILVGLPYSVAVTSQGVSLHRRPQADLNPILPDVQEP